MTGLTPSPAGLDRPATPTREHGPAPVDRWVEPLLAVATAVAVTAVLTGPAALAVPAGLGLAFVLPGTALTRLLPTGRSLTRVEMVVLAPALSLAVLVLGGLVVNATGVGLHRGSWTVLTATVTLGAAALRWWRPRPGGPQPGTGRQPDPPPSPQRPAPAGGTARSTRSLRMLVRRAAQTGLVPAVLAGVVLLGAGGLSVLSARHTTAVPVTALSVLRVAGPSTGVRTVDVAVSGIPTDGRFEVRIASADYQAAVAVRADSRGRWARRVDIPGTARVSLTLHRAGTVAALRTVSLAAS